MSRKGGTGEGGWLYPKGANNMTASGLSFGKYISWLWMGHFCPPMHEQAEKTILSSCMNLILAGKPFP